MSTVLSKNTKIRLDYDTRRMSRKESPPTSDNRFVDSSEQADPAIAVRQLIQQSVGQRLPSERVLAARLKISRPYLRSILAILQKEGLVEARPKSGTYVVDDRAKHLSRIVLLIDSDLKLNDDPFILSVVDSLQRSVQSAGARCMIERNGAGHRRPLLEDGVLTLGLAGHALIDDQRTDDPPMVGLFLDATARPNRRASVFQLEDREAGRSAAKRLVARGCRNIIFVGRRDIPASSERLQGVEEVGSDADVKVHFVSSHLNYVSGVRVGRELGLIDELTEVGIVATNDWLALGLRMGVRDRNSAASRDIPIVSFDGLQVTRDPLMGIESLAVPIDDIAADAVEELQRLHRSPASAGRVIRYPLR
jgi:DNA-binding LacI/PurR family transcriptional regulator